VLVVVIWERYFPEPGKHPIEAAELQVRISDRVSAIINGIMDAIPSSDLDKIQGNGNKRSVPVSVGNFILKYFYEPAITTLVASLKKREERDWLQVEDMLTVLRFVREIETTVHLGTNEMDLGNKMYEMRRFIEQRIQDGRPEVHLQLLRLLYNVHRPAEERKALVERDPSDLSLSHYLGDSIVQQIEASLRKVANADKGDPTKRENIRMALGEIVTESHVTRTETGMGRRDGSLQPSRFEDPTEAPESVATPARDSVRMPLLT
jgi:hypothetical protein